MTYYPVQLDLSGKRCVVVGAGTVAERKVRTLLEYGAHIRLVAPVPTSVLRALAEAGSIVWMNALYHSAHLEGAFLVFAATDQSEINETVARDAQERNILVCRVDQPEGGNFVSPAQVSRGDLVFTVSTSGLSPTLAAVIREELEAAYEPEWEQLTALLGKLRSELKEQHGSESERKVAVRSILADTAVRDAIRRGDLMEAEALARQCL